MRFNKIKTNDLLRISQVYHLIKKNKLTKMEEYLNFMNNDKETKLKDLENQEFDLIIIGGAQQVLVSQ